MLNKRLKKLRDKHFYATVNNTLCRAIQCPKRKHKKFRTRSTYVYELVIKTLCLGDYENLNLDLDKSIVTIIDDGGESYIGLYRGICGSLDQQYGLISIYIELYG